jgi:hypothetical protein
MGKIQRMSYRRLVNTKSKSKSSSRTKEIKGVKLSVNLSIHPSVSLMHLLLLGCRVAACFASLDSIASYASVPLICQVPVHFLHIIPAIPSQYFKPKQKT